jgi:aquaporin Z
MSPDRRHFPEFAPMALHRAMIAEFFGTFFLCFAGIAAILASAPPIDSGAGLVGIALAHGIALSVAVNAFGGISGAHLNPAVTLGFLSVGMISFVRAIGYIISQVFGAVVAAGVCFVTFPLATITKTSLAIPLPPSPMPAGMTSTTILILEFVATMLLMLAVFGSAVDSRGAAVKIGGFGIGLTVLFDILAIGAMTGGSMNPARSLGPTLVLALTKAQDADIMKSIWNLHWCYWAAPVAGAIVAAQVYYHVLMEKSQKV